MNNKITAEERQIFTEAYRFFEKYSDPPATQENTSAEWWRKTAEEVGQIDRRWESCPLMRELLMAIYDYIEFKAKERTKEMENLV